MSNIINEAGWIISRQYSTRDFTVHFSDALSDLPAPFAISSYNSILSNLELDVNNKFQLESASGKVVHRKHTCFLISSTNSAAYLRVEGDYFVKF